MWPVAAIPLRSDCTAARTYPGRRARVEARGVLSEEEAAFTVREKSHVEAQGNVNRHGNAFVYSINPHMS